MKIRYLFLMAIIFILIACFNVNDPVYVEKVGRITTINWGKEYRLETQTFNYRLVAGEYTLDEYVWKFVKVSAIEEEFPYTNSRLYLRSPKVIYVYDGIPEDWGGEDLPPEDITNIE